MRATLMILSFMTLLLYNSSYNYCYIEEVKQDITCYNRRPFITQLNLYGNCCLIDKHPNIDKLLYQIKTENYLINSPIMVSQTNGNTTLHFFWNGMKNILPTFLEFSHHSHNMYLVCIKTNTSLNIYNALLWGEVIGVAVHIIASHEWLVTKIQDATSLEYLYISQPHDNLHIHNKAVKEIFIDYVDTADFSIDAPQLRKLSLHGAKLSSFYNIFYSNFISLKEIEIHNSIIPSLSSLFMELTMLPALTVLNTSHSYYQNPVSKLFMKHNSLEVLDLSYCNLNFKFQSFSYQSTFELPSLRAINLSHNPLASLNPQFFLNMKSLKILLLAKTLQLNELHIIRFEFNTTENIDYIDLSSNALLQINLESPKTIHQVNAAMNNIKLRNLAFICDFPPCVENINLSYNNIVVNRRSLKGAEIFKTIDIGNNIVQCADCDFIYSDIFRDIRENNTNLLDSNSHRIMCTEPELLRGKSIYEVNISKICPVDYSIVVPLVTVGVLAIIFLIVWRIYHNEIDHWKQYNTLKKIYAISNGTFKYDAYVSYSFSAEDEAWVMEDLKPSLEDGPEKYKLCLRDTNFSAGSHIRDYIQYSLPFSKYYIIILTRQFIKNNWCKFEMDLVNGHVQMRNSSKYVIIISLENLRKDEIPSSLGDLIYTSKKCINWDLQNRSKSSLLKLLKHTFGKSIYVENNENTPEQTEDTAV